MTTYYKVTSNRNKSARYSHTAKIEYKLNRFVYPTDRNSKLFVFDSLESAKRFSLPYQRIWECEITNPERPKVTPMGGVILDKFKFWKRRKAKKKFSDRSIYGTLFRLSKPPKGTVLVDSVKITKLVYEL